MNKFLKFFVQLESNGIKDKEFHKLNYQLDAQGRCRSQIEGCFTEHSNNIQRLPERKKTFIPKN
jgi:hypothetical protein